MTPVGRTATAGATIGLTLLAAAGWAASAWSDAADAAAAAASDLSACRAVARRIDALRDRAGTAAGPMTVAALSRRVAAAIDDLGIDSHGQGRVVPQPPRPSSVAGFVDAPATVTLRRVSLRQALGFATAIAPAGSGLSVSGFRLSEPAADPSDKVEADEWDAEVTVAYRVAEERPAAAAGP